MPVMRFQMTPDLQEYANPKDCPIDAGRIADELNALGILWTNIDVDHRTGEVVIQGPENADPQKAMDRTKVRVVMQAKGQYIREVS